MCAQVQFSALNFFIEVRHVEQGNEIPWKFYCFGSRPNTTTELVCGLTSLTVTRTPSTLTTDFKHFVR